MFHPNVPDLSKLSTEELVAKIQELYDRAPFFRGHPAQYQIKILIDQYTVELDKRRFGGIDSKNT